MKTKLFGLVIDRDAMTKIPTSVPAYEVSIAQTVFGADNVQEMGDTGDLAEIEPSEEGARLAEKWGAKAVAEAYGNNFTVMLAKVAKDHEYVETGRKQKEAA